MGMKNFKDEKESGGTITCGTSNQKGKTMVEPDLYWKWCQPSEHQATDFMLVASIQLSLDNNF